MLRPCEIFRYASLQRIGIADIDRREMVEVAYSFTTLSDIAPSRSV